MYDFLKRMWRDEDGATAVEYALIVGLIALVIIGVVTILGENVSGTFEEAANMLT